MLQKLKTYLESIPVTLTSWLAAVSGILTVRFFLEALSSPTLDGLFAADFSTLMHYYLFFLAFTIIFIIFVKEFIPSFANVAEKLVSVAMIAVFIAPIVDWLATAGEGLRMAYLFDAPNQMLGSLFSFFGPNVSQGITIGIRVEVALVLLSLFLFIYFAERSLKRSILGVITMYIIAFVMLSLPGIISLLSHAGAEITPVDFLQNAIIGSETILNNIPPYFKYASDITLLNTAFNL
jgi:hypothetical protein